MNEKTRKLLSQLISDNGSDLHIAANNPPMIRIHGKLVPMDGQPVLSSDDAFAIISQILQTEELRELERTGELDAAIEIEGGYRIRINAYRQQNTYAIALRLLPNRFFNFDELGLPIKVLEHICKLHAGLVLVTGATSSGKSTTIASIVNRINQERYCHIHTIEDPIEYRHNSSRSFVTQREVGKDTVTFVEALRRSMREDPDVIVIGEMRDLETMSAALTLAETGHLTFATLHTATAIQTVSRIVSAFPAAQQPQIRIQLATTLQYVICQKLIPWDNGNGRSLVAEILYVNSAVRAMIREEKSHQINNVMQTNYDEGMRTLEQSLNNAVKQGNISHKTAKLYSE
ncbi:MAG: PilT/PilU family type 4a pilus ATPase [Planctomycetaceae bacterium]|jgi:twitching motility protein PilT|nr:PilT/PilU family type 4a pilus ATPase [Planctomycetaceae bacterium]